MDCKDEIETFLSYLLARKIQYILAVQLFAKRIKTARENTRTAEETVSCLIFLQREDFSTTFTDSSRSTCKTTIALQSRPQSKSAFTVSGIEMPQALPRALG